jgi:hypothetical protein
MKYLKTYKVFESIDNKPKLYTQILADLGYYSNDDESLLLVADKLYNKCKGVFPNSKVNNMDYIKNADTSCKLVYHSSYENFNVFKTPAFFGSAPGYSSDETITYKCILNLTNPIDLRKTKTNKEEWFKLLEDIFKDDKDCEHRLDLAKRIEDGYGFFKLLFNGDIWGGYRWDLIYDYINKNGYDGAIYRESDSSIQYYFDGFLVMKPSQIKIILKWDDDKNKIIKN